MTVGEVYWVELAPRAGHTQRGNRPAIIVQSQSASQQLPTLLVVPFTSQLDALRFPGTVLVKPDTENGLRQASVALVFQLAAIDQRYLRNRIGQLSQETLKEIFSALDKLTGRA